MKQAAIAASLVDVRNIAAHKCVRLEIHVPAEQAGAVLAAFGWPTAVDPVPVAIARLTHAPVSDDPVESENASSAEGPRRQWSELRPSARAAMLCNETAFQAWLKVKNSAQAAEKIRRHCEIESRRELDLDETKRMMFELVERDYAQWRGEKHF